MTQCVLEDAPTVRIAELHCVGFHGSDAGVTNNLPNKEALDSYILKKKLESANDHILITIALMRGTNRKNVNNTKKLKRLSEQTSPNVNYVTRIARHKTEVTKSS